MAIIAQVTYVQVVRLAEQLTHEEQKALIAHLQGIAKERELTYEAWETLFESMKFSSLPGPNFSDRRADWYDDDGR